MGRWSMSDKGSLVLAIFENEAAAKSVADWLNEWQKTQGDLEDTKLQAMAILTASEDGEIKSHRVGKHATSSGAKWGLAIGALAGLLTGGLTVIGGLAAGALLGGVGGRFVHKGLGIHEAELEELRDKLCSGRQALAEVVEEKRAQAVTAQLRDLGADTRLYRCSLEELAELEALGEPDDELGEEPDEESGD